MRSETITIRTGDDARVHDLTDDCAGFVDREKDGLLHVFVPHATAGLAILETGAGSDDDLLVALDELLPRDSRWQHKHGSTRHGRDHVLPAFLSPSMTVPVLGGVLQLGTCLLVCRLHPNGVSPERPRRLRFAGGGHQNVKRPPEGAVAGEIEDPPPRWAASAGPGSAAAAPSAAG